MQAHRFFVLAYRLKSGQVWYINSEGHFCNILEAELNKVLSAENLHPDEIEAKLLKYGEELAEKKELYKDRFFVRELNYIVSDLPPKE